MELVNQNGRQGDIHDKPVRNMTLLFKVLICALFGVVALFSMDSFELNTRLLGQDMVLEDNLENSVPLIAEEVIRDTQDGAKISENKRRMAKDNGSGRWTYSSRRQAYTDKEMADMATKFGSWSWKDEKARPEKDFYKKYPNRDVPMKKFPADSWQKDPDYVSRFLQEGKDLAMRAMEAILSEYGYGKDDSAASFEERMEMFKIVITPDETDVSRRLARQSTEGLNLGGRTTENSWAGLKRRLLHAIMTEDTFVFAMGGHSSSAGHGNHFQQSYTLQVAWVLEPVFARLGVKHQARNFGNGGLGTGHNGIAASSIYGPDVDVLMWDSGMTEKKNRDPDLMARQSIIGGYKVPYLLGFPPQVLDNLHAKADIDIGHVGFGTSGLKTANSLDELEKIAWAQRYMSCAPDLKFACGKDKEYNGTCWIERPDYTPVKTQRSEPGGRASWHPGNKVHRLTGRVLAFNILKALHEALVHWSESEGQILKDEEWHVTTYYKEMRDKVLAIPHDGEESACFDLLEDAPSPSFAKMCYLPMKGRTEFTPRAYPDHTNLRTILPKEMLENINPPPESVYDPPDVFNPYLHPPKGEIDVLAIVENGPAFREIMAPSYLDFYDSSTSIKTLSQTPGEKVCLDTSAGYCDGSLDSFCKRDSGQDCLLYGHNDGRNGLLIDRYTGWLLFNVPKVKNGLIIVKIESWHQPNDNWITKGKGRRELEEGNVTSSESVEASRRLKKQPPHCEDFEFEYSIDGKTRKLDNKVFEEERFIHQRVCEILVLLDDEQYTGGQEKDIQIGMRLNTCKNFKITHLYWS